MERISDKIAALPQDANYFSLEFFPPKTPMGFLNLKTRLERMSQALRPLFVTVTWGAGGSTVSKSLELAEMCQRQLGLTTCLHLTCTNMNRTLVDDALAEANALGIRNILALRGDPPRSEEYNIDGEDDSNKDFTHAVDLVRYIRRMYGDYFCIGVAAYPEGHSDESHPEVQDPARDLPYLVEKRQAGADFIMTQLIYDLEAYKRFEEMLRNHESGVFKTIPIIPGLMPIQSYHILTRTTKLSHAKVPPDIMARVEEVKADDEAVKQIGIDILCEIVNGIKKLPCPGPRGLHFYTLNLEKAVAFIVERCSLIPASSEPSSDSDTELDSAVFITPGMKNGVPLISKRRASSLNSQPHNRLIVDHPASLSIGAASSQTSTTHETQALGAGMLALNPPHQSTALQISEGMGALGREATWDDFPNGRWGDARSPAFGEIDGYGPSLHVNANVARQLWGYPTSKEDINKLFHCHVSGELHIVPWSEGGSAEDSGGLNAETATIREELLQLIDGRGWWTLASQPAVNGVRSDHPIFGWGPRGEGFVFQKAFVEFFCSGQDFEKILKPIFKRHGQDELSWFATNASGDFQSSSSFTGITGLDDAVPDYNGAASSNGVNAVTWGVFKGKEIITPTIIEEVSFRAWGDEAFRIWDEWRRIFRRGSPTEQLLDQLKKDAWLICVVGQKFGAGCGSKEASEAEEKFLWRVLAGEEDTEANPTRLY
ncbi:methylenetetrahydrofolate reductase [Paracoccidioides lutzii Pb01]|uniref:Methylenetetrahydrofolate reductase n=1 Tax=Paracoccidioides lutzii (strain ATCC MYA-826 / Pb01) TaxID=502779 RepID=C1H0K0_PARBA|nr:methylenetetrahydrofolate reductase [Paracoccidioides lutzii Pb01]EEH33241.1 methylenetetrahydrofolate reductase [Paracoccidioides lutzii Pb01]